MVKAEHLILFLVLLISAIVDTVQARTWTSVDGRTIEAELFNRKKSSVVLRLSNGSKSEIEITRLSKPDQNFIDAWQLKRPMQLSEGAVFLNGSWYARVLLTKKLTYKKALDKAKRMGGHLASIYDQETHELTVKLSGGVGLWLGASDKEIENLW